MNDHSTVNYNDPFPAGFNQTNCKSLSQSRTYSSDYWAEVTLRTPAYHFPCVVLIEPNVYVYYNGTYQRNRDEPYYLPGNYSTDVVADTAVEFLEDAASDRDRPFFLNVMPIGPHFERAKPIDDDFIGATLWPPVPAKRHEHLFPNATVPRTENFNPETVSYYDSKAPPLALLAIAFHKLTPFHTAGCGQLPQGPP